LRADLTDKATVCDSRFRPLLLEVSNGVLRQSRCCFKFLAAANSPFIRRDDRRLRQFVLLQKRRLNAAQAQYAAPRRRETLAGLSLSWREHAR
jgi:hypothetical protein